MQNEPRFIMQTITDNNKVVNLFDILAQTLLYGITLVLILKTNIILAIASIIACILLRIILAAIKTFLSDAMFQIGDKLYIIPRCSAKTFNVNIPEALVKKHDDRVEWRINNITLITDIPPILNEYLDKQDKEVT